MRVDGSSLTVILIGDWNKLYSQPEWIVKNVFDDNEMEITVEGAGMEFTISFKKNDIIVNSTPEKVIFSAEDVNNDTLNRLVGAINNFVSKANSAQKIEYGYNLQFLDEDRTVYYEILDSICDADRLSLNGIEVLNTKISRILRADEKILRVEFNEVDGKVIAFMNEHHQSWEHELVVKDIYEFMNISQKVLESMGYIFEEVDA